MTVNSIKTFANTMCKLGFPPLRPAVDRPALAAPSALVASATLRRPGVTGPPTLDDAADTRMAMVALTNKARDIMGIVPGRPGPGEPVKH